MSVDLVNLVSQYVTPQLVGQLARLAGVDPATAQKLVAGAIPSVIALLGNAAAAPGGAQKISDAVSNSDPDLLPKLTSALGSGQGQALADGANTLSSLVGGQGLSSLASALSRYAGANPAAAQSAIGAVSHAVIGTLGQQDPSNWSDANSVGGLLASQKGAIAAALPSGLSSLLSTSGLLQGIGGAASATAASASSAASSAAGQARAASASSGVPMWLIIVVIVVVAAVAWFVMSKKETKPAAANPAAIHYAMARDAATLLG